MFVRIMQLWRQLAAGLWHGGALLALGLRGHTEDYTRIPVRRAVLLLAVPMVLELLLESLLVIVNIFFVARLGAEAVAAVGLTEALATVLDAVAIGLGVAVTSMVARRIGEGDGDGAALAAGQALWLGAFIGAAAGLGGLVYAPELLAAMGASPAVVATGSDYARLLLGGSFTIVFLYLLNACFRGAGDPGVTLRALWIANGLNLLLDPLLIFGLGPVPALGVTGAALASHLGRGAGIVYLVWRLSRADTRLHLRLHHLRLVWPVAARLLRISVGGITQFALETASWIALVRMVAAHGAAAVAGFTIALRIISFTILPAWGLGNAAATLVGQNLGAGNPDRAERSVWYAARCNVAYLVTIGLVFVLFPGAVMDLFTADPEVARFGVECLRIICCGYAVFAIGMIMVQSLNGAGATHIPMWIKFAAYWLVQIPLAHLLAETIALGPRGVFIAILVAETLIAALGFMVFRTGRWKQVMV
jgi:putative MATE family efflux protein